MFRPLVLLAASSLAISLSGAAAAEGLLYRLEATTNLPSTNSDWDYAKVEPNGSRLFIARDDDGLSVFDINTNKLLATVENSKGANGPLLLPQFDRGYLANVDGSLLSFELKSLKPLARIQLDKDGGLNSGQLDAATKRIHFITGSRPKESTWYTLDAATGKQVSKTVFPFRKMDDPASDGKGRLFAPARYDNIILTLDSKTLKEQARLPVGCNVSKVIYQASTNRLLTACLGTEPTFQALNADTGEIVAKLPIGKGIDGFVLDETRKRIVTSNGTDGTLTVIQQNGADSYAALGTVSTQPGARMMHIDQQTGRLFVVNAAYTQSPPDAAGKKTTTFHPNSFVVLTYKPE